MCFQQLNRQYRLAFPSPPRLSRSCQFPSQPSTNAITHSSSSHAPLALSSSTAAPPIVRRPSPFLDPAVAAANNPAVAALIRRSVVVVTFGVVVSPPDPRIAARACCRPFPCRSLARSIDPLDRRDGKNLCRRRRFLSGTSSTASSTEDGRDEAMRVSRVNVSLSVKMCGKMCRVFHP